MRLEVSVLAGRRARRRFAVAVARHIRVIHCPDTAGHPGAAVLPNRRRPSGGMGAAVRRAGFVTQLAQQ